MPTWNLEVHPKNQSALLLRVAASLDLKRGQVLAVRFSVKGDLSPVHVPRPCPTARRNGLWRHTCCELFLRFSDGSYVEFNFSPSGEWAGYRFDQYRQGMAELETRVPQIRVEEKPGELTLEGELHLVDVMGEHVMDSQDVALAMVIETGAGELSYWALAHPQLTPDFHHPDSFAARLPVMSAD